LSQFLAGWNDQSKLGVVVAAPGLVFAEDDDVIPDVVWIGLERFEGSRDEAGHFVIAPDLIVEVLSPGKANKERDQQAKLKLYSRRGVREYWIVDWMAQKVEIYRREDTALKQAVTLLLGDSIESPLLPGFSCQVKSLFFLLP
jgi:Uma2 family endonuclease